MGSDRHFAQQQPTGPNVRFGSKADIRGRLGNVRFTPESGHRDVRFVPKADILRRSKNSDLFRRLVPKAPDFKLAFGSPG
jgi:hypothetical protein